MLPLLWRLCRVSTHKQACMWTYPEKRSRTDLLNYLQLRGNGLRREAMRRCTDCGFWFSFYSCRECGRALCGVCVDWPAPRLHSPGKGMCTACREKPLKNSLPISPFTGEPYDPAWGILYRRG